MDKVQTRPSPAVSRRKVANLNRAFGQARNAASLTQIEFAARLGVSLATIKAVDSGVTRCTHELAAKAEFIFGVSCKSILEGSDARDLFGREYSPNSFEQWSRINRVSREEFRKIRQRTFRRVNLVLEAGRKKQKLPAVLAILEAALFRAIADLDLREEVLQAYGNQSKAKRTPVMNSTAFEIAELIKSRNKVDR